MPVCKPIAVIVSNDAQFVLARYVVTELMNKSDRDLFCKLCAPTHALNHLLPPTSNFVSSRTRRHSNQRPEFH